MAGGRRLQIERDASHPFELVTEMRPTGDQPRAIDELVAGLEAGEKGQILLGVTGSGKTFTMANVIWRTQRPALVIAHNKTLAGQLAAEFQAFFPNNRVEYFVSYYDYYQPEAYIPSSDTYIEKDSAINEEIDRMRHSATASLLDRRDVIVVASVSCIYGLGNPASYRENMVHLRVGEIRDRDELISRLVAVQYQRNDYEVRRGTFRVRGDTLDIFPANAEDLLVRVSFFGDEIERILELNYLTGNVVAARNYVTIYPATHYQTGGEAMTRAVASIEAELEERLAVLRGEGKLVEAYRLEQRTRYDLEMLAETGFVKGIENYSRHIDGRAPGTPPYTLLDFFPDDYLLLIDEAHVTVPQIGAMYNGDHSRKVSLVDFGFRLPSAFDNRPLIFHEFEERMGQTIYVGATPGPYEKAHSSRVVEQIIRPTGLVDPEIAVHPVTGQIEDLLAEARRVIERGERVLVLTMTKKMAEDLTSFLLDEGMRVRYLHSTIANEERLAILRDLRRGDFDILVGINLLREGLDLPEVSLIAILDADRAGFLRSTTALIQIIGRAARNINGRVIMYADEVTPQMLEAIRETNRRRRIQSEYNEKHGITPRSVTKAIRHVADTTLELDEAERQEAGRLAAADEREVEQALRRLERPEREQLARRLETDMRRAARELDFEEAARLRDLVIRLRAE
ncbi:MAG: excinuclease ABC subunit UvrB [Bacillota bacterium]|nr:excinuclease ABC subunit UvrB [Bacillota bacterium]